MDSVIIDDAEYVDKRIDIVLSTILDIPRNRIQNYIRNGYIKVNSKEIKKNYKLKLLTSPAVNFQVLFSVLDIEKIQEFKKKALVERKEPRDLFDLWYISQIKKEIFKKPKIKIDPKFLKQNLGRYLPEKFKPIIKQLQ